MNGRTHLKLAGHVATAAMVTVLFLPTFAGAQSAPADEEPHGPRPEAIAACKDKSEGDACQFDRPSGPVAGTCRKVRTGDLACVHPHHHHDAGAT